MVTSFIKSSNLTLSIMETDISVPRLGSYPCLVAPGGILTINIQPEFHHEEIIRQIQNIYICFTKYLA